MAVNASLTGLSRKHGVKVGAGSVLSVEEEALAVGQKIGHSSVKSAARMNRAVLLFLKKLEQSLLLRHVVSHHRQVHMILNNRAEEFNYRFIIRVDNFDYTLFATSSALKCFNCGKEGHLARACPSCPAPVPTAPPARSGGEVSVVWCGGGPHCPGRSGNGVAGGGETE
ncbi:hypothetical protein D4764_13G0012690 [Takifugu flavidus]|uniref:CCHC-type domain-containing protein n=1 Tax=Takifugu flavidus TaxID=433684 RepID=A0A5C6PE92_9TELE|nr:hypothetical protein D4764_13G0012690 [Takifugu flavidus]